MAITNPNRQVRVKDLGRFKDNCDDLYLNTPIDITTLTPSSTFAKHSVIGINGKLYRSTQATSNLPITLQTSGDAFVTHEVNGCIAFVVADYTLNDGWEVYMDAAVDYWLNALDTRVAAVESAKVTLESNVAALLTKTADITYNGQTYTIQELLTNMAKLMPKTIVAQV